MSRMDYKEEELKKFAEIILTSQDRREMLQKMNGFRMGLTNKNGKVKRLSIWAMLIREYR